MKNRELYDLLRKILPAECSTTVVITEGMEAKAGCFHVKIKNRIEYYIFHEITHHFAVKHCMNGYDRFTDMYVMRLSDLPGLLSHLQTHKAELKKKTKQLFINFSRREFNAFLRRSAEQLPLQVYSDLEEAVRSVHSLQKMLRLNRLRVELEADLKQSTGQVAAIMQFYHAPLVSDDQLRPLANHIDELEPSLTCCFLFTNYFKQTEYVVLSELLRRLKQPFEGQTVKQLVAAASEKLGLKNTFFRQHTAELLNALTRAQEEKCEQEGDFKPLLSQPRPF